VAPNSVKVGFVYPYSGPAEISAAFRAARSGVDARIDLENTRGGVNGRRIELVWGDDQSDGQAFSLVAHNLVDTQQVFGLIAASIVADKSVDWLEKENVPVTGTATSSVWSNHSNLFHTGNIFNAGAVSTYGDFVKAQGGSKAFVVVDPNVAASQSLAAELAPSLESRGIKIANVVTYTQGVTSAARVAEQLKDSRADTLVGAAQSDPFIDIYSQARARGARLTVALNATGYNLGLLARRGKDMAGMSILSFTAPQGSAAMNGYQQAMSTYAPEVSDTSDELALSGYSIADEMIQGLRLAGACPSRQSFIQNMRKVTDYTAGGLIAPVDLSQPKQPVLCDNFVKVDQAGRNFVLVPPAAGLDRDGYWCGVALK
jgi:ABC-type branched-subunit amino acid transport system substrate-binding protein